MSVITPIIGGGGAATPPLVGSQINFYIIYNADPAKETIKAGVYEVSGKLYTLQADVEHTLTSMNANFDFHYTYLDESLSGLSSPVFYDETTEPLEDTVRNGYYHPTNTADRVVGVINSPEFVSTVEYFDTTLYGSNIRNTMDNKQIANNMNPTGAWQTPNQFESSVFLPTIATEAAIRLQNSAAGVNLLLAWCSVEASVVKTSIFAPPTSRSVDDLHDFAMWGALGATRNVRIAGENNDQNQLKSWVNGYGYRR